MSEPNFFIAGAPKAGTTSLYHSLRQHPQIYMSPVKEPAYFASEIRVENFAPEMQPKMRAQMERVKARIGHGLVDNTTRGIVPEWTDYMQLFDGAQEEKAAGEASVCYLWSRTAPAAIAARIPQAKIILILRNPADRAYSQYLHFLSDGHIAHSFRKHIKICMQGGTTITPCNPFLQYGLYAEQVERYFSYFPREQVRIWIYDDTLERPQQFLREVFEFLEVNPAFVPNTAKRYHQMEIPRAIGVIQRVRRTSAWKTIREHCPGALRPLLKRAVYMPKGALRMSTEDRRSLVEYYRADIGRLQSILDRDLSAWMT